MDELLPTRCRLRKVIQQLRRPSGRCYRAVGTGAVTDINDQWRACGGPRSGRRSRGLWDVEKIVAGCAPAG